MSDELKVIMDYIGAVDKVEQIKYKKSYKLVFMWAYFTLAKTNYIVKLDDLIPKIFNKYKEFENNGYPISVDGWSSDFTENDVSKIMKDSPLEALLASNIFVRSKEIGSIEIIDKLQTKLNESDFDVIIEQLNMKSIYYFSNFNNQNKKIAEQLITVLSGYENALKEPFAGHKMGKLLRDELPSTLRQYFKDNNLVFKGSAGQGNWASVPWLAVLDINVTNSIQNGYYITYLFNTKTEVVYLSLMFGVSNIFDQTKDQFAFQKLEKLVLEKRNILDIVDNVVVDLGNTNLGKKYKAACIWAKSYTIYDLENSQLIFEELQEALTYYRKLIKNEELEPKMPIINLDDTSKYITNHLKSQGLIYDEDVIKSILLSMKTKPFILLAGLSGSGKSRFVSGLAKACGSTRDNGQLLLVPVRPDWSDSSDVLGYTDLKEQFKPSEITEFIRVANMNENRDKPFFLCIDEMNLARVEHYFSDMLSIMETREMNEGRIISQRLLSEKALGDSKDLYGKIHLSDNLYIFGTVNMDETTYPFSNKVLDRANTIEFNHIDLRKLPINYESGQVENINIPNKVLKPEYSRLSDCLIDLDETLTKDILDVLVEFNDILSTQGVGFGYRVRDEILYFITYSLREDLLSLNEALDFCLCQKVLPKIKGSQLELKEMLIEIYNMCWSRSVGPININTSFHKQMKVHLLDESELIYKKTAHKIMKLMKSYEVEGYASFWN